MAVQEKNIKGWHEAAQWCAEQTGDINILECFRYLKKQKLNIPRMTIYNWANTVSFWEKVKELKAPKLIMIEQEVDNNLIEQAKKTKNPEMKKLFYRKIAGWNDKLEVQHTIDEVQVKQFEGFLGKMSAVIDSVQPKQQKRKVVK